MTEERVPPTLSRRLDGDALVDRLIPGHAARSPMPDLSKYDPEELNEACAKITSELGWMPFSKRYTLAARLLDERDRRCSMVQECPGDTGATASP